MEKIPLWKRVGSWLGRSQEPMGEGQVVNLDAEGLLVETSQDNESANSALVASESQNDKPRAVIVMEEGFTRLVDVLESINENVQRQSRQSANMTNQLSEAGNIMRNLPETLQGQSQAVKELAEETKKQIIRQQQIFEVVGSLPELNQEQSDRLGDIAHQLESSVEAEVQMAESFGRFDKTVLSMAGNTEAQTTALSNMGQVLERNDKRLEELLHRQSRRFAWLVVIVLVVTLAAIASLAVVLLRETGG